MPICPVTKKNKFIVPGTKHKNNHIFAAILYPFCSRRQNFNTWDFSSAYMSL